MDSLGYHDHSVDEKVIRDDDQVSVQSSSQSSVFSTPYGRYGASVGSQSFTDQPLSAVDRLVDLLADDELLKPLYRTAIHNEIIGGDRFEKKFDRLLELCSEELEKEAHEQLHIHVVGLIRTRAAYMSKRLRYMHNDPEFDNIAKERRKIDTPKIERWKTEIVEQVKSSTTLPATEPHISSTSPDFSTPTTLDVVCGACSIVFGGSLQDARANYQFHLRESPRHNRNFGLKCPMPECAKRKSMRSDKLGPHLQKVHSISSKSERQSFIQISQQYSGNRATPGPKYDLQQVAEEPGKDDGVSRDIEQELEPLGGLMDLPDLKNLEEFFLSSNAFKNLRTNFKQSVQRAENTIGSLDIAQQIHSADNNVLPGIYPETGQTASSRIHKALSLRATTMQALFTSIKCRLVQLSSHCWSLGSRMFESCVRRLEPTKDQDKVRIRWRCRCGTMLWDDFRELRPGAAEDLRASLNFHESTMNSQGTNNLQQLPYCTLDGNAAGSVARMPVSSYAAASDQSSTVDAAEGGIMTAESPPSSISSLEAKYLLLCFKKPRDTLRLYHLSVENVKNDFQLFQLLRQTYRTYRGLSGRLFSPRHVRSIAFRKLERHPRERVVIRLSPDIIPSRTNPDVCHKEHVPKCDTEYDIHPGFPDLDPYVGRNGLEHLLNYPHEAEEQGNNLPIQGVWLKRFPKKERSKLNVCPPYQYGLGWGVEFEETWNVSWILKITLLGCVLPATVFLVCWWSIRGDVQGATGMAALLISYCVLLITLISGFAVA